MTKVRTLFDPQVIQTLACTMGNKPLAFRFLGDYFDLLPRRKHRIISAVQDEDPEAAMDAILSLKIASAMVGARDAEDRCRVLQSLIANLNFHAAGPGAIALGSSVDALVADAPEILSTLRPRLTG
ncbi:Hpt domain-containing protein [Pseudarthrobacter sp. LMD1-1-1.1]|uniref:Hpt domain-containing protein n=1 Tax=Pseudarthrobacter sp. LMD1-1-1.1 TaxID=3135242 RepID=UPI00342466E2